MGGRGAVKKKNFAVALVFTFLAAAAVFIVGHFTIGNGPLLDGLMAIPILLFRSIVEELDRRDTEESIKNNRKTAALTFAGYTISWQLMTLYAALMIFALHEFLAGLAGAMASVVVVNVVENLHGYIFPDMLVNIRRELYGTTVIYASVPLQLVAAFFVGRWIGMRVRSLGFVVVLAAAALGSAAYLVIDHLLLPDSWTLENLGFILSWDALAISFAGSSFGWALVGLFGYWWGQRQKVRRYVLYLLSVLPPTTGEAMIEFACTGLARNGQENNPVTP
jgi:ABC-type methionine transport system permease subunit